MLLKEKLEAALAAKERDVNSFVWKGKKVKGSDGILHQEEVKLMDCDVERLKGFYNHCESMLHNPSIENPGRYPLLEIIEDQRMKCNAELFLRWLADEKDMPRYRFLSSMQKFLVNNPSIDRKKESIKIAVGGCPAEFEDLPISTVLEACMDTLGKFSKQHITLAFLLKQGVWASEDEKQELIKNKVTINPEYIRNYLGLNSNAQVRVNSKGLSLAQMKAMISLHSKKYSELSTLQLETLRNRILFSLENDVRFHIQQWENRERQIKLVLQAKGVNL